MVDLLIPKIQFYSKLEDFDQVYGGVNMIINLE
jgi:hypothetical protein